MACAIASYNPTDARIGLKEHTEAPVEREFDCLERQGVEPPAWHPGASPADGKVEANGSDAG